MRENKRMDAPGHFPSTRRGTVEGAPGFSAWQSRGNEQSVPGTDSEDALGLYLSVPFCRAKCTFCNFASGVYPASAMPAYVAALGRQLAAARGWAGARGLVLPHQVDTIYLGGGTPSLLPPELLTQLFTAIRGEFAVDPDAEITLEAAPLQLAPATLEAAQRSGVNRVSFGVQSFIDGEARATARTHSGAEALSEIARVRSAGIPHLSADLIAGLPAQTGASWARSVAMLAEAPLDHASVYLFELDEDSRLGAEALRGGIRFGAGLLPTDDAVAGWYTHACEALAAAGLHQYEISNFARAATAETPDGRSRHNERYWLRRPYLGLGIDAHSMLQTDSGHAARFAVPDTLDTFLAGSTFTDTPLTGNTGPAGLTGSSWSEPDRLTPTAALEESWFLGLRRTAGVSIPSLRAQFGADAVAPCLPIVEDLAEAGLLAICANETVTLTPRGRLLSNEVFAALLAPSPTREPAPA